MVLSHMGQLIQGVRLAANRHFFAVSVAVRSKNHVSRVGASA